jgi:DNA polymerase II large subunit
LQDEEREERRECEAPGQRALQRLAADPEKRLGHDDDHGGLDAQKQRLGQRHAAIDRIERRQGEDHQRAGDHEEEPADQAARTPATRQPA